MAHHKEGKVERYFTEAVKAAGGMTRKAQWIGRKGCPDQFFAFDGGRYGFVETKYHDEGELSGHQAREIKRLRDLGVAVYVLTTTEDVDWFIRSYAHD